MPYRNRARIFEVLNKVSDSLSKAKDAQMLSDALMELCSGFVEVRFAGIYLWSPLSGGLKLISSQGFTPQEILDNERTALDRHPGHVFRTREMIHIREMDEEPLPSFITDVGRKVKVRSRLWMPIANDRRTFGAFGFASEQPDYFNDEHITVLSFLCKIAANTYENLLLLDTEREMISSLNNAYEQIRAEKQHQEVFVAKMSHELRTPLHNLSGITKLLEDGALNPEQREFVKILGSQSTIMLNLVNDLLDVFKARSSKLVIENKSFDLAALMREIYKTFLPQAEHKKLSSKFSMDPRLAGAYVGDEFKIRKVVNNLMGNALKFTSLGFVDLSVKMVEDRGNRVEVLIEVSDSGIGIDIKEQESIFEEFFQGNAGIEKEFGGTGLGLSISKEIVKAMGGSITVSSQKGKGSVFSVSLPLQKGALVAENSNKQAFSLDLEGYKIHIAEDNQVNRFYIARILSDTKAQVTFSEDGGELVDYCRFNQPDLILTDLNMPIMSGAEAVRIIRKELQFNGPILGQSANILDSDRNVCLESGMDDFLGKPFLPEDLLKIIAKALNIGVKDSPTSEKTVIASENSARLKNFLDGLFEPNAKEKVEFLKVLASDAHKNMESVRELLAGRKVEDLKKIGHRMKSAYRMLMLNDLGEACFALEQVPVDIKPSDLEDVASKLLGLLHHASELFDNMYNEELSRQGAM
jgi:signal transduction histidine kinase/CheY-like chemotaxis protein/HPt (histidine-containing phosphotransfer) domain-containing protein